MSKMQIINHLNKCHKLNNQMKNIDSLDALSNSNSNKTKIYLYNIIKVKN